MVVISFASVTAVPVTIPIDERFELLVWDLVVIVGGCDLLSECIIVSSLLEILT